ncbi:MAG: hypothetical protein M0Z66_07500 [Thermaerobacter sp.]|nr:hypothetical protein [Thermaerobacter sp.]
MIVRILHEGQYDLPPEVLPRLRAIDDQLMESVAAGDKTEFEVRMNQILGLVRGEGKPLDAGVLRESDLVLPHADITLDEARKLFTQHAERATHTEGGEKRPY